METSSPILIHVNRKGVRTSVGWPKECGSTHRRLVVAIPCISGRRQRTTKTPADFLAIRANDVSSVSLETFGKLRVFRETRLRGSWRTFRTEVLNARGFSSICVKLAHFHVRNRDHQPNALSAVRHHGGERSGADQSWRPWSRQPSRVAESMYKTGPIVENIKVATDRERYEPENRTSGTGDRCLLGPNDWFTDSNINASRRAASLCIPPKP